MIELQAGGGRGTPERQMVRSRIGMVMTLLPLLARLEGRRVVASVRNTPAYLNLCGTSARGGTSNSRISQRRHPSTPPVAGSHSIVAAGGGRRMYATTMRSYSADGSDGAAAARSPGLHMDDAREALRTLFGHEDFRDGQEGVVEKLLAGESCAGVFPTGAGKSICYQLPGTLLARQGLGLTLVVSPLIALMKDQTDALNAAGVPCAKLDSTLEAHEVLDVYEQIRAGSVALLYVSPERFNNERFVNALKGVKVALFVVDEAHCISEWGHNFRPDYLRLADFAKAAKATARLALTATATPKVTVDIANRLDIPPSNVKRTPFYRPMLSLRAVHAPEDPWERTQVLADMLLAGERQHQDGGGDGAAAGAAVVYVTLQRTAVEVAQALVAARIDARPYHAGMPALEREETQDWFMNAPDGTSPVIVGTIAFGMGLDKKDVRRVFHFNLPKSPEDLAQQVGRAGRDGERSTCTTLVSAADVPLLKAMIYGGTPSEAAVRGLLRTIFAGGDDEADFNFYDLSQVLDTRDLVLKTLVAHLQIRGLARELTSYFETAEVQLLDAGNAVLDDGTEEAIGDLPRESLALLGLVETALKKKRKNAKWATLRVDETAEALGVPKQQIARMLSGMEYRGLVQLGKPGKIRARFSVLRRPASREQAQALTSDLHAMAMDLQDRELGRLDTVLRVLCNQEGSAVSSGLSAYFGDSEAIVSEAVANEQAAAAALAVHGGRHEGPLLSDVLTPPEVSEAEVDQLWRAGVLDLLLEPGGGTGGDEKRVIPCDDAYLLARFAAGIRSPRIGKLKLAQIGSFGCCAHCPFPGLLARAEAAVSAAAAAAHVPLI